MHYKEWSLDDWLQKFIQKKNPIPKETKRQFFYWLEMTLESSSYDFKQGIPGAIWLLLFLVKFHRIKDKNYSLDNVDDNIYRHTKNLIAQKSNHREIILLTHYYQIRLENNKQMNIFRFEALLIGLNTLVFSLKHYLSDANITVFDKVDIILRFCFLQKELISHKSIDKDISVAIKGCLNDLQTLMSTIHSIETDKAVILGLFKLGIAVKLHGNLKWLNEIESLIITVKNPTSNKNHNIINLYKRVYNSAPIIDRNIKSFFYFKSIRKEELFQTISLQTY